VKTDIGGKGNDTLLVETSIGGKRKDLLLVETGIARATDCILYYNDLYYGSNNIIQLSIYVGSYFIEHITLKILLVLH
jgi:hypothetical protein